MNYRHAFHAGGRADCIKHVVFVGLCRALTRKRKPLFVLDTHAGRGAYDLESEAARRTSEAETGIARLLSENAIELADYLGLVRAFSCGRRWYPGSPELARAVLREGDRLALCELHPEDAAALRQRYRHDARIQVHCRDGYEAVHALLPPLERRALILIDPPFEQPDEFEKIAATVDRGRQRFPAGVFCVWYPLKHRAPVRLFHADLLARRIPDILDIQITWREPVDPARLNGCGILLHNAPFGFSSSAEILLRAAAPAFSETDGSVTITRLADELAF